MNNSFLKRGFQILVWTMTAAVSVWMSIPTQAVSAADTYHYKWISQTPSQVTADGRAHYVDAKPGDTIAMSVVLQNLSNTTIRAKSSLGPAPAGKQVPPGSYAIGVRRDAQTPWLDSSSFVLNGNRLAYYEGSDVAPGAQFTIAWNVKIANSSANGTYDLYFRPVYEYQSWTAQIAWNGKLLAFDSADIFTRFIISGGSSSVDISGAVVTSNITYFGSTPRETSFSVFNPTGTLIKTIPVPGDLITGVAGNIKVFGSKIYYMSGSRALTSIGTIDIATGQSKVLDFTQTANTNTGNSRFGIVDFSVSFGMSDYVIWLNTAGIIKEADIYGSHHQVQAHATGLQSPIGNQLESSGAIYFNTFTPPDEIRRIDSDGSITTVATKETNTPYAVGPSDQYVAYIQPSSSPIQLAVKNLNTQHVWYLALPSDMDVVYDLEFSPDGSKVMVTLGQAMGGSDMTTIVAYASSGQLISVLHGYSGLGFLNNSKLLTMKQGATSTGDLYLIDASGGVSSKFSKGFYEGVIN